MTELRDYQQEALDAVLAYEARGVRRQLIVLPTGTGKTVVFSHLPQVRPGSLPMLVLAHREELLNQAKDKIERANPKLSVAIEQGSNYAGRPDVVVASVATLGRADGKRLGSFARDHFRAVVVDEAHHAAAPSYGRILGYFDRAVHIGVTATPQRSDHTRLTDVFDEIVYYKTISEMMEQGWLSPLTGYRVRTSTDISSVHSRGGDYVESELSSAVNTDERNAEVVAAYLRLAPGKKGLVFASDVAHARALAEKFNRSGVPTAVVTGSTPPDERRDILARFATGQLKVLSSCMVLTEGFDEPSVEVVLLARPTQSQLLYTQIVGRGTRTFAGKTCCLVIDFVDITRTKVPTGLPSLMGLPPNFELDGDDLLGAAQAYQALEQKSPSLAATARSVADIDVAFERVDIFTPPPPDLELMKYSTFIWLQVGERYFLGLDIGDNMLIECDTLGRWTWQHQHNGEVLLSEHAGSQQEAFAAADRWVKENAAERVPLLLAKAAWRADSPTEKQVKWLKKFGVPWEHLSKGEASQILDKLFADNPKPQKPVWVQRKIEAQRKKF